MEIQKVIPMALSGKQRHALELLTSGQGMTYNAIAKEVGIDRKNLWEWRTKPQFKEFQDELNRLNELRWQAAEDAARQAAIELCKEKNQKMVEFVLKNLGYNPTTKVEANVTTDINITIGEDDGASKSES